MVLLKLLEELAEEYQAGAAAGAGAEKERNGGQRHGIEGVVAGCVFLCSVPPSGNGPMTKRFIKEVTISLLLLLQRPTKPWDKMRAKLESSHLRISSDSPSL